MAGPHQPFFARASSSAHADAAAPHPSRSALRGGAGLPRISCRTWLRRVHRAVPMRTQTGGAGQRPLRLRAGMDRCRGIRDVEPSRQVHPRQLLPRLVERAVGLERRRGAGHHPRVGLSLRQSLLGEREGTRALRGQAGGTRSKSENPRANDRRRRRGPSHSILRWARLPGAARNRLHARYPLLELPVVNYGSPPKRYCQAVPMVLKSLPVRVDTPVLA
jgi:hypothetical protein